MTDHDGPLFTIEEGERSFIVFKLVEGPPLRILRVSKPTAMEIFMRGMTTPADREPPSRSARYEPYAEVPFAFFRDKLVARGHAQAVARALIADADDWRIPEERANELRRQAAELYYEEGSTEIDPDARLLQVENGTWVEAWVWLLAPDGSPESPESGGETDALTGID